MARLLPSVRERTEKQPPRTSVERGDDRSSRGALRTALLGLGLLGLVYAASRRAGSGEPALSPEEMRETVGDAVPGAESEPAIEEPADGGAAEETLPGEDRSTAEIAERAEEDVTEEPAPPGEMAVDEELVEELADEEAEDAPADEGESGREDEAESDADEGHT